MLFILYIYGKIIYVHLLNRKWVAGKEHICTLLLTVEFKKHNKGAAIIVSARSWNLGKQATSDTECRHRRLHMTLAFTAVNTRYRSYSICWYSQLLFGWKDFQEKALILVRLHNAAAKLLSSMRAMLKYLPSKACMLTNLLHSVIWHY